MNKQAMYLVLGLAGVFSTANTVNAATVNVAVAIQQANEDGSLVDGTRGTKEWDLNDEALWNATTTNGHTLNDLISTTTRWKNGGASGPAWGSAAEFYVNDLTFDVDPSLSFDFTLTNNTAFNQVYSVFYNTPLLPNLTGTVNSSANLTAVLTDVGGVAGAKMTPANGNGSIMRSWDLTVNQNQISKNVDIGSAFTIIGGSASNTWSAINTLECGTGADACETMSTMLTLTLSKGDSVRLYGSVVQEMAEPVPAPAAVWLFGSAIATLIGLRRRSRKV